MARTDEVAEQAVRSEEVALLAKHAFAVAQAFHSYYQKPALLGAPRARPRTCGPSALSWWTRSCARWWLSSLLGIPIPERM